MDILISAGEGIAGRTVLEYKDIVFGVANSSEGVGYRQLSLQKAVEHAKALGANAIVNFRLEIHAIANNVQEATSYGNAVVIDLPENQKVAPAPKINLEAYMPKNHDNSLTAEIIDANGYKFVECPACRSKYKADVNEEGHVHIKGFDDVDDIEPGIQIYCLRCGTKFTVPDKI